MDYVEVLMMSFLSWLAKSAADLQKPAVITVALAALGAIIQALVPQVRSNTWFTRIILQPIGAVILLCSLVLVYIKINDPKIKVSSAELELMLPIGVSFVVIPWYLQRRQKKAVRERVGSLAKVAADHIIMHQRRIGVTPFVDQTMTHGESVILRLIPLVREAKKGKRFILVGQPGAGKTAALLKFATDCSRLRLDRRRPLIAIYVDLASYATQTADTPQLREFILNQFGEPTRTELEKAWDEPGLDVGWIFLLDNADRADLRWGVGQRSCYLEVTDFVHRRSGLAPFHVVIATCRPPENLSAEYLVLHLDGLTVAARNNLLAQAHVNSADITALAMDKSLEYYLKNPATLDLLAPTLARHAWTASDNVHEAMGDAVDRLLQRRPQSPVADPSSLKATATAAVAFLRARQDTDPETPGEISKTIEHISSIRHQSPRLIRRELTMLASCGLATLIPSRDGIEYLEFSPAIAAYFYTCALLEDPEKIVAKDLLLNSYSRLTAVSLLKAADGEIVNRIEHEVERMLDQAIIRLRWQMRFSAPTLYSEELSEDETDDDEPSESASGELVYQAYTALSVFTEGTQNRLELVSESIRLKAIKFTKLIMPVADAETRAGLLEVSYVLGTPEQAMSTIALGLDSRKGADVLDAASRIVNAMSEVKEFDIEHREQLFLILDDDRRGQLIRLVIMAGLRPLMANRGRSDIPNALKLADGVGIAAIILYGVLFGLGGLLQLTNYWRDPFVQIVEVLTALLLVGPMVAARYNNWWRRFILEKDLESAMVAVSGFFVYSGCVGAILVIYHDLANFTLPLMPLIACYVLAWPACVLYYLVSDGRPTLSYVIFPLPRIIPTLWHTYVVERFRRRRKDH